jgi:hypothetical protein
VHNLNEHLLHEPHHCVLYSFTALRRLPAARKRPQAIYVVHRALYYAIKVLFSKVIFYYIIRQLSGPQRLGVEINAMPNQAVLGTLVISFDDSSPLM